MGGCCSSPARDEGKRQKQMEKGIVGGEGAKEVTTVDVFLHRYRLAIRDFEIAGLYNYPNKQKEYEAWLSESRRELLAPFFEEAEACAERLAVARKLFAQEIARRRANLAGDYHDPPPTYLKTTGVEVSSKPIMARNFEELHAFEKQMRRQCLWLSKHQVLCTDEECPGGPPVHPLIRFSGYEETLQPENQLDALDLYHFSTSGKPTTLFLARSNNLSEPKLRIHEGDLELKIDQIVYVVEIDSQLSYECFYVGPTKEMNSGIIWRSDVDIMCRTPYLPSAANVIKAVVQGTLQDGERRVKDNGSKHELRCRPQGAESELLMSSDNEDRHGMLRSTWSTPHKLGSTK